MSLRQKAEKIKGIKQSMRKAALVGLASLVTTTALGEEKGNGKRRPIMQKFLPVRLPKARQTVPVILTICFLTLNPRFRKYIRSAATRLFIRLTWTAVPAALSLPGSISVMPMLLAMPTILIPKNFPKHCRILRHELKILVIKAKSKIWTM